MEDIVYNAFLLHFFCHWC